MTKSMAMSCPTCLSVNDPVDMLAVTMPHSTPPQTAPMYLCRRCVLEIMKAAIGSELIDPAEVFQNAPAGTSTDRAPDPVSPGDEAASALVPEDQPGAGGLALDRLESQVPAGGEDRSAKD